MVWQISRRHGCDVVLKVVMMIYICGILKTCRLLTAFAKF